MTRIFIKISLVFIIVLFTSCSSPPADDEVLDLVFKNMKENLIIDYNLSYLGDETRSETKIFVYHVNYKYILGGLLFGYTGLGPGQYFKDALYDISQTIEIYKDINNNWKLLRIKHMNSNKIEDLWRPKNSKLSDFYADKVIKHYYKKINQ